MASIVRRLLLLPLAALLLVPSVSAAAPPSSLCAPVTGCGIGFAAAPGGWDPTCDDLAVSTCYDSWQIVFFAPGFLEPTSFVCSTDAPGSIATTTPEGCVINSLYAYSPTDPCPVFTFSAVATGLVTGHVETKTLHGYPCGVP